jgi:hypothetical protein
MAMTGKVLCAGKLPSGKTTLFTAAARTLVTWASFHNTGIGSQTLVIYLKPFVQSVVVAHAVLGLSETFQAVGCCQFWLEAGDLIEGETSTAGFVDYFISGEVDV